jgi:hypothetical protein
MLSSMASAIARHSVVRAESRFFNRQKCSDYSHPRPTIISGVNGSPAPIAAAEPNDRIARLSRALAVTFADIKVPYLDLFAPLKKSEIWMREAAANDGAHVRLVMKNSPIWLKIG